MKGSDYRLLTSGMTEKGESITIGFEIKNNMLTTKNGHGNYR